MFAGGMALGATVAVAQETGAEAPASLQRVEVTGSRIPSLNTEGSSPITTLSSKDIKIDGMRNVEDLLNNLPQVFASQGAAISNGASGTATVDLRGMGSQRTLVLINGKRMPAGSVLDTAADLNQIPSQLIRRVDVLTGGAGAVYGSGAVAGVVNFILKDDFSGVELEANISGANHRQHNDEVQSVVRSKGFPLPGNRNFDGKKYDFSLLAGANFADNKGNATFFVSHRHADALTQAQRDYSACSLGASDPGFACSGSGTSIARVGAFTPDANGNPRRYVTATDAYNFGPLNFFQRPSDEYNINSTLHYDLHPNARLYSEFNFHHYNTDAQIAPGGIFYGEQATIAYENPLLNAAWRQALGLTAPGQTTTVSVGKRNTEGGPRNNSITDMSFREVLGVKGMVADWSYDVFGQFARVNHNDKSTGYFSSRLISRALDVVADANGNAVCRSALNGTDPACVPYNLYKQGGITQAALDYLNATGSTGGYTQQSVFGMNFGTDLTRYGLKLPTAGSGVGVSFGYEQRVEKLSYEPDYENQTGDLSGAGGASPAVAGSYNVKEAFGEVRVPLLEDLPFAKRLDLNASYRHSKYSTDAKTNTWGVGLDWEPISELRFRGSAQRAVRAPNIYELYTGQAVVLAGPNDDPCEGENPKATLAQCLNTGLPAGLYGQVTENSTNQYNGRTGGNPNVKPETADTYTLGVVIEPIKNLTITLDAFKLKIEDAIQSVNAQSVFTQCLTTGNPLYCGLIHRDQLGSLWLTPGGYVEAGTTNIGSQGTSGMDVGASYRMRLPQNYGNLDFTMNGTYLRTYTVENLPGNGDYDCVGLFGATCGTPTPKWRHKARLTWSTPFNFDISATWRYYDKVKNDMLDGNPQLAGELDTQRDAELSRRNYLDLSGVYRFNRNLALSLGVNNLFDKDPPLASSSSVTGTSGNGNTYPQVYDSYGRFVYANLTYRF
ncbi:TonB-dependent receptor [Massilia sp. YIM B02763]|uniref:TonB-dependent receptor n=1 Tax=Massilia sp. YIM B02763 TaxID=3050130 RepID=UPI0025B679F6|nr:TonB-dependent receptor [Massilia sp. YIM B02763]MDN4052958.1 TonB-dependent receptor [Massilia sp. YIM B02763]